MGAASHAAPPAVIDVELPSLSTGSPTGTLAVRIYPPAAGQSRYADGAPVIIWVPGGTIAADLSHKLPPASVDVIVITLVFPGGEDPSSGRRSDGTYDDRGPNCILALRDIILYAAGELADAQGHTIDLVVPVPVLRNSIGIIGLSKDGNVPVAVAAPHGQDTERDDGVG